MIFQGILRRYFANWAAWDANGQRVCGDVSRNHAASPDYATLANRHAPANGDVASKPAVVADRYRLGVFLIGRRAVSFQVLVSVLPAEGMHRRQQGDIGANKDVVANRHRAAVNAGQVEVGV